MSSVMFMNLLRNVLPNYVGVEGKVQEDYVFEKDYSNIKCFLGYSSKKHCKAGDTVICRPKIKVNPKKCKLFITPNPQLMLVGHISYPVMLEPGEGDCLQFSVKFEKDFEMEKLEYLCRIYAIYG